MAQEVPYTKLAGKSKRCTARTVILSFLIVFLALLASVFLFVGVGGSCCFPLHASCDVDWTFEQPCVIVQKRLVDQIQNWTSEDCGTGQKCLYKLVSRTPNELKATHTTPKAGYVDDLTLIFYDGGNSCQVKGLSTSETWYALLDKGTNYCNLHNLITGAGLDKLAGYTENTTNKKCTQYSSANCEVY